MKKRDMIIIAAVLLAAAAAALFSYSYLRRGGGVEDYVNISIGGRLYEAAPLGEDKIIEIDQGNGMINHIEIKDGVVRMLDSNCANQDCVNMGSMSAGDPGIMFGNIVCLPHQVSIELRLASEERG